MLKSEPGQPFFEAPLSGWKPTPSPFFVREKNMFLGGCLFLPPKIAKNAIE
jgi:hypothetical protein